MTATFLSPACNVAKISDFLHAAAVSSNTKHRTVCISDTNDGQKYQYNESDDERHPYNQKIELKLEDDNNEVPKASQQSQTNNRPRIFLQDDDPEFDDLDEEDPDDDLDI